MFCLPLGVASLGRVTGRKPTLQSLFGLHLLGRAQPVIPPTAKSLLMFLNIIAWGPQVTLSLSFRLISMFMNILARSPHVKKEVHDKNKLARIFKI